MIALALILALWSHPQYAPPADFNHPWRIVLILADQSRIRDEDGLATLAECHAKLELVKLSITQAGGLIGGIPVRAVGCVNDGTSI